MMINYVQGCLPAKVKAIYVVNQPWYMSALWALVRPFLKEKMRLRMHVLGTGVDLLKVLLARNCHVCSGNMMCIVPQHNFDWQRNGLMRFHILTLLWTSFYSNIIFVISH